jgi:serine/threonine protein kinase
MPIEAGQQLLQYRLIEQIGEGGMGVVWKAVDTALEREVAIKVLPHAFTADPERLARFEREARLLASLNHPNIAAIHGLHESDGVKFLAMELVAGEDLSLRLKRSALSVERTLRVGTEVAAALEAAHAQGVVHRDLKPANIVTTPEGQAKVLDFGLAKTIEPAAGASGPTSVSMSPTMTSTGTVAGMILGTAGYMSPEQARGKLVDRRSDLWSLGCVLYECLTGRQLFEGETVSDSLAAILRKDPDWSALPDDTPPLLGRMLRRLLARDPARRMQDAGDVRLELEDIVAAPAATETMSRTARSGSREWLAWLVAAVAVVAALSAMFLGNRTETPERERVALTLPRETDSYRNATSHAISHDGTRVIFAAVGQDDGEWRLWHRRLDSFESTPIPGTEGGSLPFWSADDTSFGFVAKGKIWTIDLENGGVPRSVTAVSSVSSAAWNDQGDIVFAGAESPLQHVPAGGGTPRSVTQLNPEFYEIAHSGPDFLPDGRSFIFLGVTFDPDQQDRRRRLYAGSLDYPETTYLGDFPSRAFYVDPGYLFYVKDGAIEAVPFDTERLQVTGEPQVIEVGVWFFGPTGKPFASISRNGTLLFDRPRGSRQLLWYDLEGRRLGPVEGNGSHSTFRISPDGASVATMTRDPRNSLTDIWIYGLKRDTSTRVTFDARYEGMPVWSADGSKIFYATDSTGWPNVVATTVGVPGEPEPIFVAKGDQFPTDVSPDGRYLLVRGEDPERITGQNIWAVSLPKKEDEEPLLFAGTPADEGNGRFSPDGNWVAYISDETGRFEVYMREFPGPGRKVQISTEGCKGDLAWAPDGRTLYYLQIVPCPYASCTMTRVMTVDLSSETSIADPKPRMLFEARERFLGFDIGPDSERLLVHVGPDAQDPVQVVVGTGAGIDQSGRN